MEKEQLRNELFNKYFEVEDGINICDMMKQLDYILQTYKEMHKLLEESIDDYDSYDSIDMVKEIQINKNQYIIMQISLFDLIVIDVNANKLLSKKEVLEIFPNLNTLLKKTGNIDILYFYKSTKDLTNIINYYYSNKNIFEMPDYIHYKISLGNAYTFILFDLEKGQVCLGFDAKNQFLYEQLYLKSDITPSGMQDAKSKIGENRMKEMFELIKDIKIPYDVIPNEYGIKKDKQYKK